MAATSTLMPYSAEIAFVEVAKMDEVKELQRQVYARMAPIPTL